MKRLPFAIVLSTLYVMTVRGEAAVPSAHPTTGLVDAPGHMMVMAHCTACHSAALISQNRMSRERWLETIKWMQRTQKLWPLGDAEPVILDYLNTWYGPKSHGRRAPIAAHLMPTQVK
jgi:hypothetical protein